ncbi:hypothetical protein [Streptomyces sp. NPDC001851]|uniref:hypothetical protein n=1 Tax=Streptomyces sp. NPDC001851 TaxID=3154529 RepID=UPI0033319604
MINRPDRVLMARDSLTYMARRLRTFSAFGASWLSAIVVLGKFGVLPFSIFAAMLALAAVLFWLFDPVWGRRRNRIRAGDGYDALDEFDSVYRRVRILQSEKALDVAKIRREYANFVNVDAQGYWERLEVVEAQIEGEEVQAGIEALSDMLGGARIDPDSSETHKAVEYAASSVLEVFHLIGPPPPGIAESRDNSGGDAPDSGAGVSWRGRA